MTKSAVRKALVLLTVSTALVAFQNCGFTPATLKPSSLDSLSLSKPGLAFASTIVEASSGSCLNVEGTPSAVALALDRGACGGQASQVFSFVPTADGRYLIQPQTSPVLCLDVSTDGLLMVFENPCDGLGAEEWAVQSSGAGAYMIAAPSGQCLSVSGQGYTLSSCDAGAGGNQFQLPGHGTTPTTPTPTPSPTPTNPTPTPTPTPPPASCTFNAMTLASGATVTAYKAATVPSGQTCTSQVRTCNGGTLSGTYAFPSCSVSAPTVTFKNLQASIFPRCTGCHSSGNNNTGTIYNYDTWSGVMGSVDLGTPTSSKVYTQTLTGAMPRGGAALTSAEESQLLQWIQAGAPNN